MSAVLDQVVGSLISREVALLIWVGICVAGLQFHSDMRRAFWSLMGAFVAPLLLAALGIATVWISGSVALLFRFHLWDWTNLKTTIIWAFTFAFVTMFDLEKIGREPHFIRSVLRDVFSGTAIVVFIVEFTSFNLLVELILVPSLFFLGALQAVSALKPEFTSARKFLNGLVLAAGLVILGHSIWHIAAHAREFTLSTVAREFATPFILSLLFVPFIFAFSLWAGYSRVFGTLRFSIEDAALRRFAKLSAIASFRHDLEALHRWSGIAARRRPTNRTEVENSILAVVGERRREDAPPLVDPVLGWSPYAAQKFLADQGLPTNAYQNTYEDEWSCSATLLDIDDDPMPNRIGYYVVGDKIAAKRLRLKLYINNPVNEEGAQQRFREVALTLTSRAVGEEAEKLLPMMPRQPALLDWETNLHRSTLKREHWEHRLPGGYEIVVTIRVHSFEADDND